MSVLREIILLISPITQPWNNRGEETHGGKLQASNFQMALLMWPGENRSCMATPLLLIPKWHGWGAGWPTGIVLHRDHSCEPPTARGSCSCPWLRCKPRLSWRLACFRSIFIPHGAQRVRTYMTDSDVVCMKVFLSFSNQAWAPLLSPSLEHSPSVATSLLK